MKESNTLADNVAIRQLQREILLSIKGLCMKVSNTLVGIVVIRQVQREILLSIKGLCMKVSHTLVDIVVINHLQRKILLGIKRLCMKELNTPQERTPMSIGLDAPRDSSVQNRRGIEHRPNKRRASKKGPPQTDADIFSKVRRLCQRSIKRASNTHSISIQ